jgi:hypothetical protein
VALPKLKAIESKRCETCGHALAGDDLYYRERERHMADALEQGYSIQEIADVYRLQPRTVMKVIVERLGKDRIAELLRRRQDNIAAAVAKEKEEHANDKRRDEFDAYDYDYR